MFNRHLYLVFFGLMALILLLSPRYLQSQIEDDFRLSLKFGPTHIRADFPLVDGAYQRRVEEQAESFDERYLMKGFDYAVTLRYGAVERITASFGLNYSEAETDRVRPAIIISPVNGQSLLLSEVNQYEAFTPEIGIHFRVIKKDARFDWQIGGIFSLAIHRYRYTNITVSTEAGVGGNREIGVIMDTRRGIWRGLTVTNRFAFRITKRLGLLVDANFGINSRQDNSISKASLNGGLFYHFAGK